MMSWTGCSRWWDDWTFTCSPEMSSTSLGEPLGSNTYVAPERGGATSRLKSRRAIAHGVGINRSGNTREGLCRGQVDLIGPGWL